MSINIKEWIPPDRQDQREPLRREKQGQKQPQQQQFQTPQPVSPESMQNIQQNFQPIRPGSQQPVFVRDKSKTIEAKVAKRAHKRSYQSLLNTPRLPPLKKRDGEALWRKDIQYDFLHAIFSNKTKAFTNTLRDGEMSTFADVYIDAMANSTKCSRILGEKLTRDRSRGVKIAMVCLLVNWGRMNTTLNFFPEMRTVLRTYHPIPSLQTQNDQDYKQLQDAPRLKSILKGACEATNEPSTLHSLERVQTLPRTNAINLVFLMSTFSQDVELRLFPGKTSFLYSDLIMDVTRSSKSRARAFLWLVWAYLEAPTIGDNTNNPFGPRFPIPELMSPEDRDKENVDSPAELVFGNQKTLQRISILNNPPGEETPNSHGANANSSAGDEHTDGPDKPGSSQTETTAIDRAGSKFDLPPLSKPLILFKPKLRSAKDRKLHLEFNSVLSMKRMAYRRRRLRKMEVVRDAYHKLGELDQLYDSDEDASAVQSFSPVILPGVLATGLGTKYNDYGERSLASALALKRAAKRVNPLSKSPDGQEL